MLKTVFYSSLILATIACAEDIEFTFGNQNNTGTFYEFDIMVNSDAGGTRLGDALVYLNYSIDGFGSNVVSNGCIEVTKTSILDGELVQGSGLELYEIVNLIDNTEGCVAITTGYLYDNAPGNANELTTTPQPMLHVKLAIFNTSANAGLSLNNPTLPTQPSMQSQQYQSENSTTYNPVVASATDNSSLNPIAVNLVSFFVKSTKAGVLLEWQTAHEINLAGFNIFRSSENEHNYQEINDTLIANPTLADENGALYRYVDAPPEGHTYYYKLQSVHLDGSTTFYPSQKIDVTTSIADEQHVPHQFKLNTNYPNPFNPETVIRYKIPVQTYVELCIYNLNGQRIKELIATQQTAGHHTVFWNGRDEANEPVGSGTYILSMHAGDFVDYKRLTLLR